MLEPRRRTYIFATDDLAQMVARANSIEEHDLYALRGRPQ